MKCPLCGSSDTCRAPRNTLDSVWSWFNRWPYHCRRCLRKFHGSCRQPVSTYRKQEQRAGSRPNHAPHIPVSGKVEVRTHPNEPIAGIVVQANSQTELNNILLTLNQALASYGQAAKPQKQQEPVWR